MLHSLLAMSISIPLSSFAGRSHAFHIEHSEGTGTQSSESGTGFCEAEVSAHVEHHETCSHSTGAIPYRCDGYNPCTKMFPIFDERRWSDPVRALLYLAALLFVFNGVAHAVDVFMGGIEKICAHTIKVRNKNAKPGEPEFKEVNVWNTTVATLTLGAAGTCSPEILLTTIEVITNNFEAGNLGPGTIIGSAAFNLLVTTGVCIVSVPSKETRKIEQLRVYVVTTAFSIFAYFWLIIILQGSSKNEIEVWEAAVTFCLYILLVVCAYFADILVCFKSKHKKDEVEKLESGAAGRNSHLELHRKLSAGCQSFAMDQKHFKDLEREAAHVLRNATAEEMAQWTAGQIEAAKPKTTAYYRAHHAQHHKKAHAKAGMLGAIPEDSIATVEFATRSYAVREKDRLIILKVLRNGQTHTKTAVRFETVEGTASAEEDFVARAGVLLFEAGEMEKTITIDVVETDNDEADEMFYVKLSPADPADPFTRIGRMNPAEVTILGVVDTSIIEFKDRRSIVKESIGTAELKIQRKGRVSTPVNVWWSSRDITAVNKEDYLLTVGALRFESGEQEKSINVDIIDTVTPNKSVTFAVTLTKLDLGKGSCDTMLGDKQEQIVTIISDDEVQERLVQADKLVSQMLKEKEEWKSAWRKQFVKAMSVNDGDIENATGYDYFMHFISFCWKTLFAFIPPPTLCGGYITFIAALCVVGILTAIVSDLATVFGCICHLDEVIVGAALVSVGTNLPDLFASRFAAIADEEADNAVGHISGSCSINVYLGLGIPWLTASVYWMYHGKPFCVNTSEIGRCVIVYCFLSVVSIAFLLLRRRLPMFGQAELGGPKMAKIISAMFLFIMWIGYLLFTYFKRFLPQF